MISYQTLTGEVVANMRIIKKVVAFVHRITPDGEWYFSRSDIGKVTAFPNRDEWNARRQLMLDQGWEAQEYVDFC